MVDCFFVMLEVVSHVRGGEGVYEGVKEIPYGGGRESIDEITKAVIVKEVEDDKAGGVGRSVQEVVVGTVTG